MIRRRFVALGLTAAMLMLAGCTPASNTPSATGEDTIIIDNQEVSTPTETEDMVIEIPEETTPPEPTEEEKLQMAKEERAILEEKRKEQYGEFYVPLPAVDSTKTLETVEAKSLYITNYVAGFSFSEENINKYVDYVNYLNGTYEGAFDVNSIQYVNKLEKALALCKATEVNALVIDVKGDDGHVAWESDIDIVNTLNSNWVVSLENYENLMSYLEANDIYTIARVVTFKDPYLAKKMPEHAIQLKAGGVYVDYSGYSWVNPFDKYVWDYTLAIAKEAALRGFNEIQFDYVRFPDNAIYYNSITEFPHREGKDKDEAIEAFLTYAKEELDPYSVHTSADVFGIITRTWDDKPEDIGQTWRKIAAQTDSICPMIYPSHYGPNWYGFATPDQNPYGVLRGAIMESIEKTSLQEESAAIRPWIQGFTATWVDNYRYYDHIAISDQIIAGVELGVNEYIIWSPDNNYDPRIFFYHDRVNPNTLAENEDLISRTPEEALIKFLTAQKYTRYSHLYKLTSYKERVASFDEFALALEEKNCTLTNYTLGTTTALDDGSYDILVSGTYTSNDGVAEFTDAVYHVFKEKGVYKVRMPEMTFIQPTTED